MQHYQTSDERHGRQRTSRHLFTPRWNEKYEQELGADERVVVPLRDEILGVWKDLYLVVSSVDTNWSVVLQQGRQWSNGVKIFVT